MLTTSLLNPDAQPAETTQSPAANNGFFIENLQSIYSTTASFFFTPEKSALIKLRGQLSLHRSRQNWHARQILLAQGQLGMFRAYVKKIQSITMFEVSALIYDINLYFEKIKELLTNHKSLSDQQITDINQSLRRFEGYFQLRDINPSEQSLKNFKVKLAEHLYLFASTDERDTSEDTDLIVNYIFCSDMYEMKYSSQCLSDEEILGALKEIQAALITKNFSTSPFELKFHNTGIFRRLMEKVTIELDKTTKELDENKRLYEVYSAKVQRDMETIDDMEFMEEQEPAELSSQDLIEREEYQLLSGGV